MKRFHPTNGVWVDPSVEVDRADLSTVVVCGGLLVGLPSTIPPQLVEQYGDGQEVDNQLTHLEDEVDGS
jgi:hypothetical protein